MYYKYICTNTLAVGQRSNRNTYMVNAPTDLHITISTAWGTSTLVRFNPRDPSEAALGRTSIRCDYLPWWPCLKLNPSWFSTSRRYLLAINTYQALSSRFPGNFSLVRPIGPKYQDLALLLPRSGFPRRQQPRSQPFSSGQTLILPSTSVILDSVWIILLSEFLFRIKISFF